MEGHYPVHYFCCGPLNGTIENPILIRGARHDARYDTLPKQWNQIKIREGNLNAENVILKGGTKGFNLENDLVRKGTNN